MKLNRPVATVLKFPLMLGLMLAWGATSLDVCALDAAFLSCEEMDGCFEEQLEEEIRDPLASNVLICTFGLEVEAAGLRRFLGALELSNTGSPAAHPFGWMMPFRI
ncbi:MAG: hypothetical protein KAU94_03470 [Verrucomicrobia bacterium]|nr:hypothetical protein [Verrucomicrobiota bacterium]